MQWIKQLQRLLNGTRYTYRVPPTLYQIKGKWLDWAEISQGKEPKFSGVPLNYVYKIVTFKKKMDRKFSDKLQLIGWVRYGGNLMQVIKYPLVLVLPTEPGEQQVGLTAFHLNSTWISPEFHLNFTTCINFTWQFCLRSPPSGEPTLPPSSQAASRWQCFR